MNRKGRRTSELTEVLVVSQNLPTGTGGNTEDLGQGRRCPGRDSKHVTG
jgi:hypothetical protein